MLLIDLARVGVLWYFDLKNLLLKMQEEGKQTAVGRHSMFVPTAVVHLSALISPLHDSHATIMPLNLPLNQTVSF